MVLAAASLLAVVTIQAQTSEEAVVKNDIKQLKKEKRSDEISLKKLEGEQPSFESKQHFQADFANAQNVNWTRSSYMDEAIFTLNGVKEKAFYDYDGNLVGTVLPKQFSDLPQSAQKQIQKGYKDYTVNRVILYDDNENNDTDMLLYGSQFEDADNYFVELSKPGKTIILQVNLEGLVSFFKEMKS